MSADIIQAEGTMCKVHGIMSSDIIQAEWPSAEGTMRKVHGIMSADIRERRKQHENQKSRRAGYERY